MTVFSQTDYAAKMPNIIPPAPEASSLFKFTETPVSMYSGLANISVPIYTIEVDGLEIPISLNYHSRGIKVEEIASRIGLGWSLNAGGAISRQVRGRIDDEPYGYLSENFYDDFFTNRDTRAQVYDEVVEHNIDMDPDLFMFNFGENSGKFIFDQTTKAPLLQQYSDIKIDPIRFDGRISGFIAIDSKGNKYYFGTNWSDRDAPTAWLDREVSEPYAFIDNMIPPLGSETRAYNTWHLTKIETYLGDEVTFEYFKEETDYWRRNYDVLEDNPETASSVASYFSHITTAGWQCQLKQINFPSGRVVFIRSTSEREDFSGYALDHINIYDQHNKPVKEVDLYQHYQTGLATGNELAYLVGVDPTSLKRLFLDSVKVRNESEVMPPYKFEYSSVQLPNRFSNSQDAWGYYNGANNGSCLTFFAGGCGSSSPDRRVDTVKCGAGLLKKMTYPTGGTAEYEYQQNIGHKSPNMNSMVFTAINPVETQEDGLGILDPYVDGKYSKNITFGEGFTGRVYTHISFTQGSCEDGTTTSYCRFTVILRKPDKSIFKVLPYGKGFDYFIDLPPGEGTYILEVMPTASFYQENPYDPNDLNDMFTVILHWEIDPIDPLIYGGGKRISKITYTDGNGTVQKKEYRYVDPDTGETSGKILGFPAFYSINDNLAGQAPSEGSLTTSSPYGSRPGSPLTSVQGNEVGYEYVQEYVGGISDNIGKTEYQFTIYPDEGEYYDFPYTLPIDNEWLRGKPTSIKYYKRSGSSYFLQRKEANTYIYSNVVDGFQYVALTPLITYPPGNPYYVDRNRYVIPLALFNNPDTSTYKLYYQLGGSTDLYSKVVTDYFEETPSVQLETTTTYAYDYDNHYQLTGSETVNSKGNSIVESIFYPPGVKSASTLGYDNLTSVGLSMVNKLDSANRFVPVQVRKVVKDGSGNELSDIAKRTIYKDVAGKVQTDKVQVYKQGEGLEDRLIYYQYADGKPVEISMDKGTHQVYIWGYNKKQVVAKIENATYAQVSDYVSNIQLKSDQDIDHCTDSSTCSEKDLRTALDALRTALPNALVTTYTYDPLIGVTSETDPNGRITYYNYDALGRLNEIKDQEENILKEYHYHYKN